MHKILIVEDEFITATYLQNVLEKNKYRIVAAVPSGEEAVEIARSNSLDLVLMDIQLAREMSGFEAAETICQRARTPILFLTANCTLPDDPDFRYCTNYRFTKKPFVESDLIANIETMFRDDAGSIRN